jgi:CelD/BcsL family acetyltransferase involved in cellulose biosynthesis
VSVSGYSEQSGLLARAPARPGGIDSSHSPFEVEWRPMSDADSIRDAWRSLSARALEPNVFYDPAFAPAAATAFGRDVMLGLVWSNDRRLVCLWPARIDRFRYGGSMPVLMGWTHSYAPLGVPLLDRDAAVPALAALLNDVAEGAALPNLLLLPFVTDDGPFAGALKTAAAERCALTSFGHHARALLAPGASRDDYLDRAIAGPKRKELRRQRRRLAETGNLTLDIAASPERIATALDDFLQLEAQGWKGKASTAIAQNETVKGFIQRAVALLAMDGHARVLRLLRDQRSIAAAIVLRSGTGAWFWKIAYDETLAPFSPGVQLTLDVTQNLLNDRTIAWADSCATADHPMIDRLWRERRAMTDWLISVQPGAAFSLAGALESLRRRATAAARSIRDRLTG